MIINHTKNKAVRKEETESWLSFLNQYIELRINEKMPELPYSMSGLDYETATDVEKELDGKVDDWKAVAIITNISRGKENLRKRRELWEKIKSGDYTLVRNNWGVTVGIQ
jgi:hypothetical protein